MASDIFERLLARVPEKTKRKVHKDMAGISILYKYLKLFGFDDYSELVKVRSKKN